MLQYIPNKTTITFKLNIQYDKTQPNDHLQINNYEFINPYKYLTPICDINDEIYKSITVYKPISKFAIKYYILLIDNLQTIPQQDILIMAADFKFTEAILMQHTYLKTAITHIVNNCTEQLQKQAEELKRKYNFNLIKLESKLNNETLASIKQKIPKQALVIINNNNAAELFYFTILAFSLLADNGKLIINTLLNGEIIKQFVYMLSSYFAEIQLYAVDYTLTCDNEIIIIANNFNNAILPTMLIEKYPINDISNIFDFEYSAEYNAIWAEFQKLVDVRNSKIQQVALMVKNVKFDKKNMNELGKNIKAAKKYNLEVLDEYKKQAINIANDYLATIYSANDYSKYDFDSTYDAKFSKINVLNKINKSYHFDEFTLATQKLALYNLAVNNEQFKTLCKRVSFNKHLIQYIKLQFGLNTFSNIKMYEILETYKLISIKNAINFNSFHLCDQTNKIIEHYIITRTNIKNYKYDNIELTNSDDILKIVSNACNNDIMLVTSNCGPNINVLRQIAISLMVLSQGGCAVFKLHVSLMDSTTVSIAYLLYMLFEKFSINKHNSESTKVYFICNKLRAELDPKLHNYLLLRIKKNDNLPLFPREAISRNFISQFETLINNFAKCAINYISRILYYLDNPEVLNEHIPLITTGLEERAKTWIKQYNFQRTDNKLIVGGVALKSAWFM